MRFILALLITFSSSAYSCEKDVTYLEKGTATPCEGYLFSPDKEKEVRYKVESYKYVNEFANKQGEIIVIMDQRLTNLQEHNKVLSEELNRKNKAKFWQSTFYFTLGVLVTGAIARNVP